MTAILAAMAAICNAHKALDDALRAEVPQTRIAILGRTRSLLYSTAEELRDEIDRLQRIPDDALDRQDRQVVHDR